jgi:hypothetical protein
MHILHLLCHNDIWKFAEISRSIVKSFLFYVANPKVFAAVLFARAHSLYGQRGLSHCATSRKVAGSIADGSVGIFHWPNPSGRTRVLESTQPET